MKKYICVDIVLSVPKWYWWETESNSTPQCMYYKLAQTMLAWLQRWRRHQLTPLAHHPCECNWIVEDALTVLTLKTQPKFVSQPNWHYYERAHANKHLSFCMAWCEWLNERWLPLPNENEFVMEISRARQKENSSTNPIHLPVCNRWKSSFQLL